MIEDLLIQGARWGPVYLSKIERTVYNPVTHKAGSNVVYDKNPKTIIKLCDHDGNFRIERENMRVLNVVESGEETDFSDYLFWERK